MNEVKESLRSVEQKYQLFQQQQFTFIAALEHCRENASDKIRPISSIGQSLAWWAHSSKTSQGGSAAGAALETPARGLGRGTGVPGAGLSRPLLPPCRCPPDMANCLSCHEVRNHCGGVVSLIPIVLDMMKEWVAHSEKLPCKALQHGATVKNRKRSATSLPGLVSWDLSLKENDIHPKTPEDAGQ
ncbi:sperm acrosome-associated protein 9 [Phocoena sinus]|uniref:sperm acrosome-associated protein 9 n=1 Tax=Phocoena sinus TaxID=42100 RepID=UPI0013C44F3B|nr:sperm acrosome-associated protein 9 [Phocoena sinus]